MRSAALLFFSSAALCAQSAVIIAGTGVAGFSGDGGP